MNEEVKKHNVIPTTKVVSAITDLTVVERDGRQVVSARNLHTALDVGRDFSTWIKDRIEKYGFIEGKDFSPNLGKSTGGRPGIDYLLSGSMAKEIAMVENNEKGQAICQYLIKVEEAWNSPQMIMARALQVSQNR
ncbi:MAG: antA/AntB antirepressor family protein [Spirochaetaceae bacterium]|jgi:anti-repressor protein|nr:antA/AntB antirepressor family protein [Spirochaetaceae bacterium]